MFYHFAEKKKHQMENVVVGIGLKNLQQHSEYRILCIHKVKGYTFRSIMFVEKLNRNAKLKNFSMKNRSVVYR